MTESKTLFVTGGTGFIGLPFVRNALQAGYTVQVLCRSASSAAAVRALGAVPITGDLLVPGDWQQVAADAPYVVHIAQPQTFGGRVTAARARQYHDNRLAMDCNLLDSLNPSTLKRIVYVAGTSYYGEQGDTLRDETATPNPKGWGPFIADALHALPAYRAKGLKLVEAYPGGVYGVGSWYITVLETLAAEKRLVGLQNGGRYSSSIHVEDCARAILHLLNYGDDHAVNGERYFLVDDRPATSRELAERSAAAVGVPLRTLIVPPWLARLIIGPVITESLGYGNRLSNAKLRATGFTCQFPSIAEGVPDIVRQWRAMRESSGEAAKR